MADVPSPERANNGVGHEAGLMRNEDQVQQSVAMAFQESPAQQLAERLPEAALRRAKDTDEHVRVGWNLQQQQHRQRPAGLVRGGEPTRQQQQEQRDFEQTAPEVIHNLPARKSRQWIPGGAPIGGGGMAEQPRQQLPVAANPAMLPFRKRSVRGGVILHQLDVDQPRAGVLALNQIVAED